MFDAFPYDAWGPDVADFWAFGGANSTGTYIMTALGIILMFVVDHRLGPTGDQANERARGPAPEGRHAHAHARTRPDERVGATMANKQIEFPPEQTNDKRVAPFMLILSVVCIVIVVALLLGGAEGSYIGPW